MEEVSKKVKVLNLDPEIARELTEEGQYQKLLNTAYLKGQRAGEKTGEESGKKQGIIETAKKLIKEKVNIETIVKVTGLSKTEIQKLGTNL